MRVTYDQIARSIERAVVRQLTGILPSTPAVAVRDYAHRRFAGNQAIATSSGAAVLWPLVWDTELLDVRTGTIGIAHLDGGSDVANRADALAQAIVAEAADRYDLLIARLDLTDLPLIQALERRGHILADIQVPLVTRGDIAPSDETPPADLTLRSVEPADIPALLSLANQAFIASHFYTDDRLPVERVDALYAAWIRNACAGRAAVTIVAESAGDIAGFFAGLIDDDIEQAFGVRRGHIDLVAIRAGFRDRGYGYWLVRGGMDALAANGCTVITVATQATNVAAIRLYQRCGFTLQPMKATLHGWSQ